jgi:hypothetical protein
MSNIRVAAAASLLVLASLAPAALAQTQTFGPSPYLSQASSPFNATSFSWSVLLNGGDSGPTFAPGVTFNTGVQAIGPGSVGGIIDSVDGDDGVLDGCGAGRSYFACPSLLEVTFNASIIGGLPTHAGLVWTDGWGAVTFTAFDAANNVIATITGASADGSFSCGTAEDRFYGVSHQAGIARIRISDVNTCIEVDHIQAGIERVCDSIDFNGDSLFPDTTDIDDFLRVFAGGACSTGTCGDIDFNNDGLFPDTQDIDALISVFAGGGCL